MSFFRAVQQTQMDSYLGSATAPLNWAPEVAVRWAVTNEHWRPKMSNKICVLNNKLPAGEWHEHPWSWCSSFKEVPGMILMSHRPLLMKERGTWREGTLSGAMVWEIRPFRIIQTWFQFLGVCSERFLDILTVGIKKAIKIGLYN